MRLAITLAAAAASLGCSPAPKHAASVAIEELVPARCAGVTIRSFTRPCQVMPNGDLMCDRVRVKVNCIAAVTTASN